MKLYELTKGDRFVIDETPLKFEVYVFNKIDGAYSICFLDGDIVHLSASTPVIKM